MCGALYDAKGKRYGSIADLRAAGFVIEREDWFDEEYQLEEDEAVCACTYDLGAIVRRSGLPFTYDAVFSDYTVETVPTEATNGEADEVLD